MAEHKEQEFKLEEGEILKIIAKRCNDDDEEGKKENAWGQIAIASCGPNSLIQAILMEACEKYDLMAIPKPPPFFLDIMNAIAAGVHSEDEDSDDDDTTAPESKETQ